MDILIKDTSRFDFSRDHVSLPVFTPRLANLSEEKIVDIYASRSMAASFALETTPSGLSNVTYSGSGYMDIPAMEFLKKYQSSLIQRVKNINPIVDDLSSLHPESVANVRAQMTPQDKMRKLLEYMNSEIIAQDLVNALRQHESDLMNEIYN